MEGGGEKVEKRLYEGVDEAREASTGVERRGKRLRKMEERDVRFLAIHPFNRREECENKGSVLSSAVKRIWSGNTVGKHERKREREFRSDGIRGHIFLPPIRRMKYGEFGIKQPHKTRIILNVFFLGRKFSEFILRANLSPSDAERRYRFQPSPSTPPLPSLFIGGR